MSKDKVEACQIKTFSFSTKFSVTTHSELYIMTGEVTTFIEISSTFAFYSIRRRKNFLKLETRH